MNSATEALIYLENLSKIFYTDDVETNALSGLHLQINAGEFLSIAGLRLRQIDFDLYPRPAPLAQRGKVLNPFQTGRKAFRVQTRLHE